MSEYTISQIRFTDKRAVRQMEELLKQEGIERDKNLDYSVGLFDEDYQLAATGSCFHNTLRCLAVSSAHQGEGLLNQVITHLIEYQYSRGNLDLFLYTKCNTAKFFEDLGFHEIARADGKVVFMENRKTGFFNYLNNLKQETKHSGISLPSFGSPRIGAVIMNANPFTCGHQYLLETASSQTDLLHVFLVSEDVSLVPFSVREHLLREGSAHLSNLVYHQTGPYMISNATFPSYFLKDSDMVIRSHASLDIQIFLQIARVLSINCRFVGEEPFSQVTSIYNQVMKQELTASGLDCIILPRKKGPGESGPISASLVRLALQNGDRETLQQSVPQTTLDFFDSPQAAPILEKIKQTAEIRHY